MIRLLVVGTGGMADTHANAFAAIEGVSIVAGVDTNPENLRNFTKNHNIAHGFATIQEALAWGDFDAVCNVTPDAVHHRVAMPCLAAGKHMLCEKPLATSHADASEMAQAAAAAGIVNMVNFTYRNSPALMKAAEIVAADGIGDMRHFEGSYLQSWLTQPAWGDWRTEDQWLWRLSKGHGSHGVLGDVGIHILDFATYAAGANVARVSCRLATFPKAPDDRIGNYRLDANDSAMMHVTLTNGAAGVIHASRFASGHLNDLHLRLFGTKGGLIVTHTHGKDHLQMCAGDDLITGTWVDIETPPVPTIFERFIAAIRGKGDSRPSFAHGADLQRVLDAAVTSDTNQSTDQVV
ncbi:Gfo/Idh/MocA family protein [Yoonia sp. 2307UL14-13]|uniref:Gfo/Idh/MocA family protein n=1 Tax=Yoonia sp. 2307UL14-13 TaxID=3126506 RepID=UPI0030AD9E2A